MDTDTNYRLHLTVSDALQFSQAVFAELEQVCTEKDEDLFGKFEEIDLLLQEEIRHNNITPGGQWLRPILNPLGVDLHIREREFISEHFPEINKKLKCKMH